MLFPLKALLALLSVFVIIGHEKFSRTVRIVHTSLASKNASRCIPRGDALLCLPNVLLLGASKTGTSSWLRYLTRHPNISSVKRHRTISSDKSNEVHRFDNSWFHVLPYRVSLIAEWEHSPLVRTSHSSVIHYTPHYLYAPSVPYDVRNFYSYHSELKFLVMLRNPVDRALSSYWFKNSKEFDRRHLDKGSIKNFLDNFKKEKSRRAAFEDCLHSRCCYKEFCNESLGNHDRQTNLNILKKCFGRDFYSPKLGLRHIDKGIYADQISRWLQNFHLSQFHFLVYENWVKDPLKHYHEVLQFLGHDKSSHINATDITKMFETKYVETKNAKKREVDEEVRAILDCYYKPYNEKLAQLLNVPSIFNETKISCSRNKGNHY